MSDAASFSSILPIVHMECTRVYSDVYQQSGSAGYGRSMPTDEDVLQYVLRRARSLGMNQSSLADALHTGRATVTNWISKGKIPDDRLRELAGLLGVSVDQILAAGSELTVIRHAGDRIALLRRAAGLTQAEVAEQIGWSLAKYVECEKTGVLPPTREFLELAELLRVRDPRWLASGDPPLEEADGSARSRPGKAPTLPPHRS